MRRNMAERSVLGSMRLAATGVLSLLVAGQLVAQERGAADTAETALAVEANFTLFRKRSEDLIEREHTHPAYDDVTPLPEPTPRASPPE